MNVRTFLNWVAVAMVVCGPLFVIPAGAQEDTRWWQREVPAPTANQILNPDYLRKRRELEQAWDQLKQDMRARSHFQSLGQKTSSLNNAVSSSRNKVNKLEHELLEVPMYIAAERAKDGVAPQPTAPHSNTQTEERPPLIIRSNQSEMAEEGKGEITVIYHHYVRTTRMTPEPVESGGGISAYCWVLYPASYIENFKRNVAEFGETTTFISMDGYRMQGTRDDAAEAVKALEKGNEVFCRLRRPAALPLKVPAGKYYLDYWIELRHNSGWGTDVFGPRLVNRRDGRDWGPYEITVTPNSQLKINVTPYGDNVEGKNVYRRDGFSGKGLWNLINYSDRLP